MLTDLLLAARRWRAMAPRRWCAMASRRWCATASRAAGCAFLGVLPLLCPAQTPALPPAPVPQAVAGSSALMTAEIAGVVVDSTGALVSGARVTLREEAGAAGERSLQSDAAGHFLFSGLPQGTYTVTLSAPGLESLVEPNLTLRPGEHRELPEIALPVARKTEEVNVTLTRKELAAEEIKVAEHQRVLAIFPNFYTSFQPNPAPMDAKQKVGLALHAAFDPAQFATVAGIAGAEQLNGTFPEYGTGPASYGKRYGAALGDAVMGRFLGSAVYPSLFRQDPRYFYQGTGSVGSRVRHAVLSSVLARHDSTGRWEPHYSHLLGNASAGAVSTLYHPDKYGPGTLAYRNALIGIGGGAALNLVREFLLKPFTHGVPPSAP